MDRPRRDSPLAIGLTGPNAAGKSEVGSHLTRRGFAYHSLSDIVREEADRRGLDHSRLSLIEVGNDLRRAGGPAILAVRIRARLGTRDAIDSIRNPAEVEELRGLPHFHLLGIDAPAEVRFERARLRGRVGDGDTLEQFRQREEMENAADPASQQLRATLALADTRLVNEGTLADLQQGLDRILREWGLPDD